MSRAEFYSAYREARKVFAFERAMCVVLAKSFEVQSLWIQQIPTAPYIAALRFGDPLKGPYLRASNGKPLPKLLSIYREHSPLPDRRANA